MREALRKIDVAVVRVERFLAGALFLVMALATFVNVVHRIFSREDGRLSAALLSMLRGLGMDPDPQVIHGPVSLGLNVALTFLFSYAALRTMKRDTPLPRGRALALAALATALLTALVKLLLWTFPNGLVSGPAISMSCMLWVGFLGASIATHENRHLALEMGEKIWPRSVLRYIKALAMVAAAGMSLFLLTLAVLSITDHYETWTVNHLAGNLLPTSIPKWVVFTIFPYTFVVMTIRFLARGARHAAGVEEEEAPDSEIQAAQRIAGGGDGR